MKSGKITNRGTLATTTNWPAVFEAQARTDVFLGNVNTSEPKVKEETTGKKLSKVRKPAQRNR